MLPEPRVRALVDPGQVLGVALVTHSRAHRRVGGEGDAAAVGTKSGKRFIVQRG